VGAGETTIDLRGMPTRSYDVKVKAIKKKTLPEQNDDLAKQLGFSGTPSWVVGDAMLSGAVGRDSLAKAIASAQSGTQGT